MTENDAVNHPAHYTAYKGLEVIDLTEQMNFNKGNAVKYIARAGLKDPAKEIEDLEKAKWYIQREIERLRKAVVKNLMPAIPNIVDCCPACNSSWMEGGFYYEAAVDLVICQNCGKQFRTYSVKKA